MRQKLFCRISLDVFENYLNRSNCFLADYVNAGAKIADDWISRATVKSENICDSGGLKAAYRAFKNVEKNFFILKHPISGTL